MYTSPTTIKSFVNLSIINPVVTSHRAGGAGAADVHDGDHERGVLVRADPAGGGGAPGAGLGPAGARHQPALPRILPRLQVGPRTM